MLIAHLKDEFPNYASKSPQISDLQAFYKVPCIPATVGVVSVYSCRSLRRDLMMMRISRREPMSMWCCSRMVTLTLSKPGSSSVMFQGKVHICEGTGSPGSEIALMMQCTQCCLSEGGRDH